MTTRTETPNILDNVLTLSGATPAPPAATLVALTAIVNDGGTQMRAGMDAATITEYADALAEADAWPFPPIVVFHDGEKYWLADGFHRVNAAHRSGKFSQIPADVRAGTRRDAILHAAGANAAHGLRRTNGDKRRAVEVLLRDEEWRQWGNREIARRCAVDEKTVRTIRDDMYPPASAEIPQIDATRTVQRGGQVYQQKTTNIGTNRSARLYVGDLKGLVAKWMGMHWPYNWPDNPSHTNGEFWRSLVAWMHENVRETWQEGDLKEAIKALQWLNRREPQPPAPAPSQRLATAPARRTLDTWIMQSIVETVRAKLYGDLDLKTESGLRMTVRYLREDARNRSGLLWRECVERANAQGEWTHNTLVQAINNLANILEERAKAIPAASLPSPLAPDAEGDLHAGAGRTPAPPLTVAELVEDLDGYLAGIPAAEIDQAAKGAQNRALMTAQQCLSDFTYRQADLYRALQRLALQRGAPQPAEPVVDGERPLPAWAAPEPATVAQAVPEVVAVHGEVAPRPSQLARHPQHDELFEFAELFKLAIKETHRWAHITGEHTAILEAERGLRHLVERTAAILDGFTGQP